MNQYATLDKVPTQFNMTNPLQPSAKVLPGGKGDGTCQKSFDYFETGKDKSVYWGSSKPMKEVCSSTFKSHSGMPTHSLWNNSTKRKTIVNK
jgi:hypothetical protein